MHVIVYLAKWHPCMGGKDKMQWANFRHGYAVIELAIYFHQVTLTGAVLCFYLDGFRLLLMAFF